MPGMSRRSTAKWLGDSASQYKMINFHLPPIAASAAVSGHPLTGLARAGRGRLPASAFLMELMGQTIFTPEWVSNDNRSPRGWGQPFIRGRFADAACGRMTPEEE